MSNIKHQYGAFKCLESSGDQPMGLLQWLLFDKGTKWRERTKETRESEKESEKARESESREQRVRE